MGHKKLAIRDNSTDVIVTSSKGLLKDYWKRFKKKKNHNGKITHFDTYRQSLGGRGIWGTKIFFRALIDLNFIMECDEDSGSKSKYCPTKYSMDKYESLFCYIEEDDMWGLSEKHLDEFDEKIFPSLIKVARRLEEAFTAEKKEKARLAYQVKKAKELSEKSVVGEDTI